MTQQAEERSSTRTRLITAALQTLEIHGVNGLTLDAVAQHAGISKGGLLHHFRSKDALIEALLQHLFTAFDALVQQYVAREHPGPGRWLRAYVRATYDDTPIPLQLAAMVFGAVVENERLMQMIQADAQQWQERLSHDGVPWSRATIIRQAADATWTERMLRATPLDQPARDLVLNDLLALIDLSVAEA